MGSSRRSSSPPQHMTSSTVTQQALPDYAKPYFQKMMRSAEALTGEDYQPYQAKELQGLNLNRWEPFRGSQL